MMGILVFGKVFIVFITQCPPLYEVRKPLEVEGYRVSLIAFSNDANLLPIMLSSVVEKLSRLIESFTLSS